MTRPLVWILRSAHAGDNTQLLALVRALGYPYEIKSLSYRKGEWLPRMLLGATLAGVDLSQSSSLGPPPPDLVLCAGRATEAAARWIRANLNARARLVYIGPPWSNPRHFDLVISSPQYRTTAHPHVLNTAMPLHDLDAAKLAESAKRWCTRLGHLPRPLTAVLAGGASGPYRFGAAAGARLGRLASARVRHVGGALLVSTSARTPAVTADALTASLSVPADIFRWQPGVSENPLMGYFALADDFIVTADSISMIAEACSTGKPVFLFDTEEGPRAMRAEEHRAARGGALPAPHWRGADASATLWRLAMAYGAKSWTRDIRIVHRKVVTCGLAAWTGDPAPSRREPTPSPDLAQAVRRIHAFFEPSTTKP